ncbi:hypothetical protein [Jannaschia sp. 2305UL9-9]|uniref:hypothetical protein n=1 Tax=Jannaschia sp. 2305UL9-9 TaxID=3121638 RepID=UPI003527CCDC
MTRLFAALCALLLATPLLAQDVRGTCVDGSLWWGSGTEAALGPCDAPQEGFFRLICTAAGPELRVISAYPIAADQRGTVDLSVDGRTWRLEGRGAPDARTGVMALHGVTVPAEVISALAGGNTARFDMPTETRPIHLTGSGAALAALTC